MKQKGKILEKEEMQKIRGTCNSFLKENNIKLKIPIDVYDIAINLGFTMSMFRSETLDGFIIVDEEASKIMNVNTNRLIGINGELTVPMRRFILAHELAHYYIDSKGEKVFAHRESKTGKNYNEQKMDFFAANILMPEKEFMTCLDVLIDKKATYKNGLNSLSTFFNAPIESVQRRIEEIDILNNKEYKKNLLMNGQ